MKVLRVGCCVLGLFLTANAPALAQDSTRVSPAISDTLNTQHATPVTLDSTRRPTTPMGAMFRSFLLPGWGQATYGRKVTGGVMMAFEGLSIGMLLKIKSDERYIEETNSTKLRDKRQQEQDWITLIVFDHLMSGLEAYVSAHLYDFPGDLQMQALPDGRMGLGVTLPLGRR